MAWWRHRRGLPEFGGLKVCWAGNGLDGHPEIARVEIAKRGRDAYANEMVFGQPGHIGGGGNSGFQALNLAVNFGSRLVLLVGFDMVEDAKLHWYGRNNWPGANNPDRMCFRRWTDAFEAAALRLRTAGVEVLNASPKSSLQCFEKVTIDGYLQRVRGLRPAGG